MLLKRWRLGTSFSLGGRWRKPREWESVGQQLCTVRGVVIAGILNPGRADCFASVVLVLLRGGSRR